MNSPLQLPPMLLSEDTCRRCFANKTCALYHIAVDGGSAQSSGMDSKFDELTGLPAFSHHDETCTQAHMGRREAAQSSMRATFDESRARTRESERVRE